VIKHPAEIRIGDTVIFDVPSFANSIGTTIDNSYTLTWYGRTNTASKGASVTGTNQGDGWRITIPSSTTDDWVAGTWYFQLVAVKSYSIAGRNLQKYELADLLALETKLKAEVKREQTADLIRNGQGNPHNLFVRF
jgi:hypothetical protein